MAQDKPKLKLAVYWGAACGGCCVSVLDVHEKLLDILAHADLVFWPIALDIKYQDVEQMPDQSIDITLFNGAVRNSENEHMAHVLRRKSRILVAYGSCAYLGGIPGLANFYTKEEVFRRVYEESESLDNPQKIHPLPENEVTEGHLHIPSFYNDVLTLAQVVDVDYFIPGCPPQSERLVEVFMDIVNGSDLPLKGSVIGASSKVQCDECKRKKSDKKGITRFYRPWEVTDDGMTCLNEQGILCMGPATRAGCGVRCVEGNAPCRGCYGPLDGIGDAGTRILSAIASMLDGKEPEEINRAIDSIVDPAGTFYRFSLPGSKLRRKVS
ncbi:MAG: F420-nonreducing hydrogenase [Bacteroidales bacterium]|nr:F420-nonreducing hydrogenase [Bacteroidales bacterium]